MYTSGAEKTPWLNALMDRRWNQECTCDITVYFDTDFEYAEGPEHLGEFGGREDSMFDMYSWIWEDRQTVWDKLVYEGMWPNLGDFPNTLEGTRSLYTLLKEQGYPQKFAFGLLVWHQLGYVSRLVGNSESGQCGSRVCWHRSH